LPDFKARVQTLLLAVGGLFFDLAAFKGASFPFVVNADQDGSPQAFGRGNVDPVDCTSGWLAEFANLSFHVCSAS
jgi:hypothetical protein